MANAVNLIAFIKGLPTSKLVALHNATLQAVRPAAKEIKKFETRVAAELRLIKHVTASPDYPTFYAKAVDDAANFAKVILPPVSAPPVDTATPAKPVAVVEETPEQAKARRALARMQRDIAKKTGVPVKPAASDKPKPVAKKKQKTHAQLNLRCPACGYAAKGIAPWMEKARLVCPVNKAHGKLLTAEERDEARGRR